jgi:pimeloyl-ACP methyl ester carboxylesterase
LTKNEEAMTNETNLVDLPWRGRDITIEYQFINPELAEAPLLVFLHEGLGSVAMWRDFPKRLCDEARLRGLVYSRPGYGRSTPRPADEFWDVDFMHRQAQEVMPALFDALRVRESPWLFGHSDGGSIALLYAASFPDRTAGVIVLAPHILVEALSVTSIAATRETYLNTDLPRRLSRYHDDVDSAFWGWNNIWLHPPFEQWNIEVELESITCPVLAIQGLDDEYGTLRQIRGIAARLPETRLRELPECGHSPHRDQPDAVIAATKDFIEAFKDRSKP